MLDIYTWFLRQKIEPPKNWIDLSNNIHGEKEKKQVEAFNIAKKISDLENRNEELVKFFNTFVRAKNQNDSVPQNVIPAELFQLIGEFINTP